MRTDAVGKHWCAYQWAVEPPSVRAFEQIMDAGSVGCHRTASPIRPPHTSWQVYVLGEDMEAVDAAAALCVKEGGEPFRPPAGLIDVLRRRRIELALRNVVSGRPIDHKITERDTRKVIGHDGKFYDLKEDDDPVQ